MSGSRGGFDKGTLAAALIGRPRAGEKPAQSADKRTGRRPLSNPPLCQRGTDGLPPVPEDTRASRYCQEPVDCNGWLLTLKCQANGILSPLLVGIGPLNCTENVTVIHL